MELLKLNIQKFASGTIDLGTSGNMKGRITWSSVTNGATANTSTITANIQVARTNSYTTTGTFTGNVYISDNSGGSNETFSKYTNVSDSWVTLYTRKFTAKHNNDGSGTAYIGGTIYGPSGTSLASNSVSDGKNVTLDKIARKATISDATNMNDEQNPTVYFSNPGGMSLVPYINLYLNGSVALRLERSKGSYSSPYTWNITDEEREQIRDVCKNVNSTTYTIGFDSYSGSTSLGYDSVQRTLTIVNANPVFNDFNFEDVNPITLALTGNNQNIIRNYSNVKSTIPVVNKAEALKSATMSKYRFNCNGNSTDITYSSDNDVNGTLNGVTSGVFDVYAIDSRNNSKQVTKNANSVIDYTPIVKGDILAIRINGVSESVTLKLDGKIDLVNFGAVTNSIKESKYRYKATDEPEWSDYKDLTLTVDTDGNFAFNDLISGDTEELGFNVSNSYQVEVLIADELSPAIYTATFGSGTPNLALTKKGVAVMQKYDNDIGGALQVNGNMDINGEITVQGSSSPIYVGVKGDKGATGPQGPQGEKGNPGTDLKVLGVYDTLEELKEEHPTGEQGDVYLIDGFIYVWDISKSDWAKGGNIANTFGDTLPIGSQIPFAGEKVPNNWLLCDGSELSRTEYADLFAVIGTSYGVGDGSTTFNLPDKRGKVSVGLDSNDTDFDTLGKTGGEATHTLTIDEMPSHNHTEQGYFSVTGGVANGSHVRSRTVINADPKDSVMGATGGSKAHNNLQPYQVDNWIIKAFQSAGVVAEVTQTINDDKVSVPSNYAVNNALQEKSVGILYYKNTTTQGAKWANRKFNCSGGTSVGKNITVDTENSVIKIKNCKAVKISACMHITSNSYSYKSDIVIGVGGTEYEFRNETNNRDYIIPEFVVVTNGQELNIYVAKYTNDSSSYIYTNDSNNFMSVELIGEGYTAN